MPEITQEPEIQKGIQGANTLYGEHMTPKVYEYDPMPEVCRGDMCCLVGGNVLIDATLSDQEKCQCAMHETIHMIQWLRLGRYVEVQDSQAIVDACKEEKGISNDLRTGSQSQNGG